MARELPRKSSLRWNGSGLHRIAQSAVSAGLLLKGSAASKNATTVRSRELPRGITPRFPFGDVPLRPSPSRILNRNRRYLEPDESSFDGDQRQDVFTICFRRPHLQSTSTAVQQTSTSFDAPSYPGHVSDGTLLKSINPTTLFTSYSAISQVLMERSRKYRINISNCTACTNAWWLQPTATDSRTSSTPY